MKHLKLYPDASEYFVAETGSKWHMMRMQAVLKAYVKVMRKG